MDTVYHAHPGCHISKRDCAHTRLCEEVVQGVVLGAAMHVPCTTTRQPRSLFPLIPSVLRGNA